ncbi:hypothetical protein [Marivita sp. S2033]|uniref:hypothetical protein n=1 Tax=Marivita sp. S2033 TaxID=3373187 RepID=UPI003982651D
MNTLQSGHSHPHTFPDIRELRMPTTFLPESDYAKLRDHLADCEAALRPSSALLAHVLSHKLMTTEPVSGAPDTSVVVGGCHVTYSIDDGVAQSGLLVHNARAGMASGVIPVASLLGAALIGMRAGHHAPLLREDGSIGRVKVLDAGQPV